MNKILQCRRTFIALTAIGCLTAIALVNKMDTSMALASVAIGLAAANSYQGAKNGTPS